jgi:hypothetical protein
MKTVCVQMVMKMLTDDKEVRRKEIYSDHLIVQNKDKMWIFQYYSETKHQLSMGISRLANIQKSMNTRSFQLPSSLLFYLMVWQHLSHIHAMYFL